MAKIRIYMGIPSMGDRSDAQVYRLRDMQEKYADKVELVYPKTMVIRVSHDFARNAIVDDFLSSDCDLLWFLDSDIVPHPEVLSTVISDYDKFEIAGSPYPVFITQKGWDGPQVVFAVYSKSSEGKFFPCEVPGQGTNYVDGIATGCLFIKKDIFSRVERPYFEHKYDPQTRELIEGEDLGFCRKVSDLGMKFYINFSHVCKHYKRVDLLDVNNYAIDYANKHRIYFERELSNMAARIKLSQMQSKPKPTQSSGLVVAHPYVSLKR